MSRGPRIVECPVERIRALIPIPAPDANKYTRGKLVVIGGDRCYPGSVCLLSQAAYRMGAGYVEAFCDAASIPILQTRVPSAVARERSLLDVGLLAATRHPHAIAIGSGMDGADSGALQLVCTVLQQASCPLLVDGGALGALASSAGRQARAMRSSCAGPVVLTPHLGEATRLAHAAGIPAPADAQPRSMAALSASLAEAYEAFVVLKGPDTYLASPLSEEVARMVLGTPALAKAGTGDVLAGMAGALLAQGLDAADAVLAATVLHAEAGRLAADDLGPISVMAEDVVERIPAALMRLR